MNLQINHEKSAHRFQHFAMNTQFEIFIIHNDFTFAQSAAHEAFLLLDRLEEDLSRFKENSDVARINQLQAGQSTLVSPETFECLQWAQKMHRLSHGLFDPGAGLLFDFFKGNETPVAPKAPGSIKNLKLIETGFEVLCLKSPVSLDLGGIGKGFALDKMLELLQEWQIDKVLLHGGYSSVVASGQTAWPLSLHHPFKKDELLQMVKVKNRALGASGLHKGDHIVNPQKGQSITGKKAAWVLAENATLADALSTICLLLEPAQIKELAGCKDFAFDYLIVTESEIIQSTNFK